METVKQDLNDFLVDAFNTILQIEEDYLSKGPFKNLSVKEMHVIDAVVKLKENNAANRIARELNITQSSLTTAVSTLEKKGMLIRKNDRTDRRIVKIYPTARAIEAYNHHKNFHKELVERVMTELSETELKALAKGLDKISGFFSSKK